MKSGACEVEFDRQSIVDFSVECLWKYVDDVPVQRLPLLHIYHLTTPRTHSHTTPLEHYNIALVARSEQTEQTELGQPHN